MSPDSTNVSFKIAVLGDEVIRVAIVELSHSFTNGPTEDCLRAIMAVLDEHYPQQLDVLLDFSAVSPIQTEQRTSVKMYCAPAQLSQVRRLALVGSGAGMEGIGEFLGRSGRGEDQAMVFSQIEPAINWLRL